ncbi:hypothetical protein BDV95DRAFT_375834 [Massariosphaeria phaeospora]|uniref:Uncharacterized protein n=1 Tax=Massariosphaeria phaeospora TaxID=100035 RepID=A0A7C8MRF1_9PLEO|nr:hypothetical protein BDV95DRAFT_375834 [Massariosphaeria phaeospora]
MSRRIVILFPKSASGCPSRSRFSAAFPAFFMISSTSGETWKLNWTLLGSEKSVKIPTRAVVRVAWSWARLKAVTVTVPKCDEERAWVLPLPSTEKTLVSTLRGIRACRPEGQLLALGLRNFGAEVMLGALGIAAARAMLAREVERKKCFDAIVLGDTVMRHW